MASPRVREEQRYAGESCSQNRVARLMQGAVFKVFHCRSSGAGSRQVHVLGASEIIRTAEGWLYLRVVIDLHSDIVVG